ncbi:DNA-binding transcriptional regulator, GntR family [Alloyangia pacifica]|uniref:DNA-binding transcriptional regulator, GntR family n=2 Tax=Alloyangia pacifica TaxID=311180 RepID=A0A1I6QPZ7_9RHOB|nr:DNA-binding transcriptional regulator, GntR family [Alloyangia pacifica]SFS54561.1 DNA-binding transcriptional regulator, GntR family [Alloyangia pacifica]
MGHDMVRKNGSKLLAANVHDILRQKILTLEFKPGTRLIEDEISETLGVGRTPVREALLRLQGEGFVAREKGWVVDEIDPADAPMLFESRIAIEGYATRLAAKRRPYTLIATLRGLAEKMSNFSGLSRAELNALDREFHRLIVEASGNAFFIEMHERTQYNYWNLRLPILFTREQVEASNAQHLGIIDAIEAQDDQLAEELARAHIATTMTIVQDALSGF